MIELNRNHLQAVSLFAAKDDVRYYLRGVLVEVNESSVRYVATDGHTMAIAHQDKDDCEVERLSVIIPIDALKTILREKSIFAVLFDNERNSLTNVGGLSVNFTPIDGTFPDYRNVVPAACSGENAHYNPEYLARFQAACRVYSPKSKGLITVEHNGDGPGLVHGVDHRFIGMIMPFRADAASGLPDWWDETKVTNKAPIEHTETAEAVGD